MIIMVLYMKQKACELTDNPICNSDIRRAVPPMLPMAMKGWQWQQKVWKYVPSMVNIVNIELQIN